MEFTKLGDDFYSHALEFIFDSILLIFMAAFNGVELPASATQQMFFSFPFLVSSLCVIEYAGDI
jgi:hypothetical protein